MIIDLKAEREKRFASSQDGPRGDDLMVVIEVYADGRVRLWTDDYVETKRQRRWARKAVRKAMQMIKQFVNEGDGK